MSAAAEFLAAIRTPTPMPLGPEVRAGVDDEAAVLERVRQFVEAHPDAEERSAHLRAAALLWHDRLDASHRVSQDLEDADGAYLHGLMHRREPDYDNAKYWFARVGPHPLTARLASAAKALGLRLTRNGRWDHDGYVDAVAQAVAGTAPAAPVAELQTREFAALVEHLLAP